MTYFVYILFSKKDKNLKEKFESKTDAFNRERFLKSLWAGRFKNKIRKEYLDKISHSTKKNG